MEQTPLALLCFFCAYVTHSPDLPKTLACLSEEKDLLGRSVLPSEDPAACWGPL